MDPAYQYHCIHDPNFHEPERVVMNEEQIVKFKAQVKQLVNSLSIDTALNTPDYILADYLTDCLANLDRVIERTAIHAKRGTA